VQKTETNPISIEELAAEQLSPELLRALDNIELVEQDNRPWYVIATSLATGFAGAIVGYLAGRTHSQG
jgi:hypothetical protein